MRRGRGTAFLAEVCGKGSSETAFQRARRDPGKQAGDKTGVVKPGWAVRRTLELTLRRLHPISLAQPEKAS